MLKHYFAGAVVAIITLCTATAGILCLMLLNQHALVESQEVRFQSYLRADELRQSSDDLTRFARTFVVTGDEKYDKMYRDVLAIRNGDQARPEHYERIYWDFVASTGEKPHPDTKAVPLRTLMEQLGFNFGINPSQDLVNFISARFYLHINTVRGQLPVVSCKKCFSILFLKGMYNGSI